MFFSALTKLFHLCRVDREAAALSEPLYYSLLESGFLLEEMGLREVGEGPISNQTAVRDKMICVRQNDLCQLSYLLDNVSLGHVGPLNERSSTDFV